MKVSDLYPSYDPWMHLSTFPGACLRYDDLPIGTMGLTDFERRSIRLARQMSAAETATTLAHELLHLERGPLRLPAATPHDARPELQDLEERVIDAVVATRMIATADLHSLASRVAREGVEAVADDLGVCDYTVAAGLNLMTALGRDAA